MFFGKISAIENDRFSKISKIENLISWEGSFKFLLNFHDFRGGFFLNKKLPYKPDDFLFEDNKKDLLVLMSGSVYNRSEIQSKNTLPASLSNPELIAELFNRQGPAFVENLNGDFAICIYDFKNKEFFLFRDHIGIQPLGYTFNEEEIVFSSDVLSLSRACSDGKPIVMDPYISGFKAIDFLLTPNQKVKKLIPGHYLHFSDNKARLVKYWFPERLKPNQKLSYKEALKTLDGLVKDAVKIRSDQRFCAGAHLSGGLDSGLVAPLVRKNYPHQAAFKVFSYSPEGEAPEGVKWDERVYVKEIAQKHEMEVVFCTLKKSDYQKYVYDFYNNRAFFSEQKAFEKAHENNVNLIFTGWGGNEFISKEGTGIDSDLLFQFRLKKFFERNPITKPRKIARTIYYFILLPALGILDHQMAKAYRRNKKYLKVKFNKNNPETVRKFFFYRSRRERQLNFIYNYYNPELTEHWAVWGYKNGIVYRYPLLDKRIIEFILTIPSHLMVRNETERILIRDLCKDLLPESVLNIKAYIDPVYFKTRWVLTNDFGASFMDEVKIWAKNPDLDVFDFEKLQKDIELFKKNPNNEELGGFKPTLVYLKMLHEFTKTYRSLPEGFETDEAGEIHNLNTGAAEAGE